MESLIREEIQHYIERHSSDLDPLLEELLAVTQAKTGKLEWSIGKVQGQFLRLLVALSRAKTVVDVGTLTGFSALIMAEGLPADGRIITCESDPVHAEIARGFFQRSPRGGQIQLEFGPALETLRRLPAETIDAVFIDADKSSYPLYYEEALRLLKPGGWIAVDNVLWEGEVVDEETADPDVVAIKAFNRRVRDDIRVEKVMLSIRDGLYLIVKKDVQ
jgi:caffeoyl-CoA O-methyltransferase